MRFGRPLQPEKRAETWLAPNGGKGGMMSGIVWWIMVLAVLAGVATVAAVLFKAKASGQSPREMFFKPRPDPRIGVTEFANIDGKRKLLLVRRDDVEHLIMTGGPVDVVIETGIGEPPRQQHAAASTTTVFSRPPRATFGTASASTPREEEAEVALKR